MHIRSGEIRHPFGVLVSHFSSTFFHLRALISLAWLFYNNGQPKWPLRTCRHSAKRATCFATCHFLYKLHFASCPTYLRAKKWGRTCKVYDKISRILIVCATFIKGAFQGISCRFQLEEGIGVKCVLFGFCSYCAVRSTLNQKKDGKATGT